MHGLTAILMEISIRNFQRCPLYVRIFLIHVIKRPSLLRLGIYDGNIAL